MSSGDENHAELLTVQETAELLKVQVSWVYGHTRKRSIDPLPGYRLGKYWRFRADEVMAWVQRQRRHPVHHFKCGMSKILGAAEEWGYITENVAQKMKLPRRQHGAERVVLTPVQVRDIAAALHEP